MRYALKSLLALVVIAVGMGSAWGQDTFQWNNTGTAGTWFGVANWQIGGVAAGKYAGSTTVANGGTTTDVATFNTNSTLINVNASTISTSGGTIQIGAFSQLSNFSNAIANSSGVANRPVTFQLNGAYAANTGGAGGTSLAANTVINVSAGSLTIRNGTTNSTFVSLGQASNIMTTATSTTLTISSVITEATTNAAVTINGTGTTIFSGNNLYAGGTTISSGTFLANNTTGSGTGTGDVNVSSTATLGGSGFITGAATISSGGTIRGGSGASTATLSTGNVIVNNGGTVFANLAASGTSSQLSVGASTLDFKTGSVLKIDDVSGFNVTSGATWTIAQLTSGNLQLDGANISDGFVFGTYTQGSGSTGAVTIDVTSLPALGTGDQLILSRTGNNLVLTFVPVPEPSLLFGLAAGLAGVGAVIRKKFFTPAVAA